VNGFKHKKNICKYVCIVIATALVFASAAAGYADAIDEFYIEDAAVFIDELDDDYDAAAFDDGYAAYEDANEDTLANIVLSLGAGFSGWSDPVGKSSLYPAAITLGQALWAFQTAALRVIAPGQAEEQISVNDPRVKGKAIPIMTYHAVADVPWTSNDMLFVRPKNLEAQLKYLADNGYQTITFEDLDNIGAFSKPVMLTFDDGYKDNYTVLYPLLKEYNLKATIFIMGNAVWSKRYLSVAEIVEMADSGHVSIQSHTMNHLNLSSLGKTALDYELSESKAFIESITGKPVVALCYPYGSNNGTVRAAAAGYYRYAVNTVSGKFVCGTDLYSMKRIMVGRGMGISSFAASL